MVTTVCVLWYITDRQFSHSGPEFTYIDTGFNLSSYTWIVLQVHVHYTCCFGSLSIVGSSDSPLWLKHNYTDSPDSPDSPLPPTSKILMA